MQYSYNAQGALATYTDAANRVTTYGYVQGRFAPLLTRISDNWSRVVSDITYDPADRVKSYTDKGETYSYTYAYGGNPATTAKTDSQGNVYQYPFAGEGLVVGTTPPAGGATHTDRYPDGSVQQFTDGVGVKTYYTYTANGSPLSITKDYQGPNAVRYDYVYDVTFPSKATSVTAKDPGTGTVNPDWQAWQYDYYQAGSPAPGALHHFYRVKDTGVPVIFETYEYNSKGQKTKVTSATGGVTDLTYDTANNLSTVTLPSNNDAGTRPVTTYGYDALGRVTSVKDALSHSTLMTYDALDRARTRTLPKPSSGSPLTFTTTYNYDNFDPASGLVFMNTVDANNLVSKEGYDQYDQLVKSIDALNASTVYAFSKGLVTSKTDANNNVTTYSYDAARRLTRLTYPDGAFEQYGLTGDGLISTKTDRKNQVTTYTYDSFKRLRTKTYPGGASVSYTFDGQKVIQIVDTSVSPTDTHLVAYDDMYRVSSATEGGRGTINYIRNADDTLASYSVQGGPSAAYSYYPNGSLSTIVWSPVAGQFKYTYLLTGQYSIVTFPNGLQRTYARDDQGRLTQSHTVDSVGTNVAQYDYGYDFNYTTGTTAMLGQRTSVTASVPSLGWTNKLEKFEYDARYALVKATYPAGAPFSSEVDSWTYDSIGNRVTNTVNSTTQALTYQHTGSNPLNWDRLVNDGVNAYTYDANGNTSTRGSASFSWDYDNRLSGIPGTATYVYDYQGRRAGRTVGGASTTYLYDKGNLIRESGSVAADYLFGPHLDEPLAQSRGGSIYYYIVDGLGSTQAILSASGSVQATYVYDAWGQVRSQTGTLTNPFTYVGREQGEAGTLFFRARYLVPGVARFLSEDPIASLADRYYASGRGSRPLVLDAFAYVSNAPILNTDPLGFLTQCEKCDSERDQRMKDCWSWLWVEFWVCADIALETLVLGPEASAATFIICKLVAIGHLAHCTHEADVAWEDCKKTCRCPCR